MKIWENKNCLHSVVFLSTFSTVFKCHNICLKIAYCIKKENNKLHSLDIVFLTTNASYFYMNC